MQKNCVFCKVAAGELPRKLVLENEDFVVVASIDPKVKGHSLVITKKHFENFVELDSALYEGMLRTTREAVDKLGCKDFNLVLNNGKLADQLMPHVHLHILPRREGDDFRVGV